MCTLSFSFLIDLLGQASRTRAPAILILCEVDSRCFTSAFDSSFLRKSLLWPWSLFSRPRWVSPTYTLGQSPQGIWYTIDVLFGTFGFRWRVVSRMRFPLSSTHSFIGEIPLPFSQFSENRLTRTITFIFSQAMICEQSGEL